MKETLKVLLPSQKPDWYDVKILLEQSFFHGVNL